MLDEIFNDRLDQSLPMRRYRRRKFDNPSDLGARDLTQKLSRSSGDTPRAVEVRRHVVVYPLSEGVGRGESFDVSIQGYSFIGTLSDHLLDDTRLSHSTFRDQNYTLPSQRLP